MKLYITSYKHTNCDFRVHYIPNYQYGLFCLTHNEWVPLLTYERENPWSTSELSFEIVTVGIN
jgi:hypothetical protein